jgi:hypothetical protein
MTIVFFTFMCCTTVTRPITKTAQKHKKNTPIHVTKENTRKRDYKKSHSKIK